MKLMWIIIKNEKGYRNEVLLKQNLENYIAKYEPVKDYSQDIPKFILKYQGSYNILIVGCVGIT